MKFSLPIPKELAHLKTDDRGYPIPFFVSIIDGKPEFRFLKPERLQMIIDKKLCHICGKKLPTDYFYFLSGPQGLQNRVSTDAPMHRGCAEFSLFACPHLFLQKAERRDNDERAKMAHDPHKAMIMDKPDLIFLDKCNKVKQFMIDGRSYLRFFPVATQKYIYENNRLTKAT